LTSRNCIFMKVSTLCLILLVGLYRFCYAAPPAPITLPNGMRVVVRERRTSPLVGVDLWVRAGAREERPDEAGCAHFLEHLVFKGTATRSVGEVDIAIENLGATLQAATGPDFAHFFTTVASVHLPEALTVLADVVAHATLPDAEIERERGVIRDELAQRESKPTDRIVDALYAHGFSSHSYRRSPGGTAEAIQVRSRRELLAFYTRNYTPERCTLALTGDIDAATANELATRIFGKWTRRVPAEKPAPPVVEPEPTAARTENLYVPSDRVRVGIGFRAPAASETDAACAALVTVALLGRSDRSGRLSAAPFARTEAEARYTPRQDTSLLILTAALPAPVTRPGQPTVVPVDASARLAKQETALLDAIESLRSAPPSVSELNAAKSDVRGRMLMDTETSLGLARAIGYADMVGGDMPENLRARLDRLTPADILRFARRTLDPARRVTVKLFPTQQASRAGMQEKTPLCTGSEVAPSPPTPLPDSRASAEGEGRAFQPRSTSSAFEGQQAEEVGSLCRRAWLAADGPLSYSSLVSGEERRTSVTRSRCNQNAVDAPQLVTLTDGVRLILKPEATTEVVAVTVVVRTPPDRTPMEAATGELVARALFFGSVHRTYELIADSVARVGGSLETLRTPDTVAITCQTVPERLGETIYLLCESLKNAEFKPEALERARQQILADRERRATDLFETTLQAVTAPLQRTTESDGTLLRRVTPEVALNYFRARYVPSRTVITVVGRFNAKQVARSFDNNLFDFDRQPPRALPLPPGGWSNTEAAAKTSALTGSAALALVATSAPDVASPDYPAFCVLHALLGDGHASRLFRRIRDALGIGYNVGALYRMERGEPLIAYLQWDARRPLSTPVIEEKQSDAIALRLLQAQLDSVLTDTPTDAELLRARNVALGRDALRHERARDRAFLLGWYEAMGRGFAFDAQLPQHLAAVTRDDVLKAARRYLKRRVTATALPR
jgi:zinc protease